MIKTHTRKCAPGTIPTFYLANMKPDPQTQASKVYLFLTLDKAVLRLKMLIAYA